MDDETPWKGKYHPQPGGWQDDGASHFEEASCANLNGAAGTSPLEQSRLLEFLGLINFKILSGHNLYLEVNGAVYKILYGGYWQSVFTGVEHYFLRCNQVADGMWIEGNMAHGKVDLDISQSDSGWLVKGNSLRFMVFRD